MTRLLIGVLRGVAALLICGAALVALVIAAVATITED